MLRSNWFQRIANALQVPQNRRTRRKSEQRRRGRRSMFESVEDRRMLSATLGSSLNDSAVNSEASFGPGSYQVGNALWLVGGNTNDQLNITPIGTSQTGSTGINVKGKLNNVNINNQQYTGINTVNVTGFGGNDNFQFAGSLTLAAVISDGDGNDQIQLGNGNNSVTLGNGNDQLQGGNGNNTITVGSGNDSVQLGNGNNNITAGTGNVNIKAGDGTNNIIAGALGSTGNIQVQLGNGAGNNVMLLGDGNHHVQAGDGAGDIVTITGNGNNHVQLGDVQATW